MTHLLPFAQDKPFIKCLWFWNLLVVIENTYLEQMAENEFTSFCISETNPFVLKKNQEKPW